MFLRQHTILRSAKTFIILAGLSLSLSACGMRGPLETPPEAKTVDGSPAAVEKEKPHRGFILDGLLN